MHLLGAVSGCILRAMDLVIANARLRHAPGLHHVGLEDAYYPFGRHNMLEVAFLAAHLLGAVTDTGLDRLFDAVTTSAARVMGIEGHVLEVGGNADLVVLAGSTVRQALAAHAPPAYVIHGGTLVAESTAATTIHRSEDTGIG